MLSSSNWPLSLQGVLGILTAILVATILALAIQFPLEISKATSAGISALSQAVVAGMFVIGVGPSLFLVTALFGLIAAHTVSSRDLLIQIWVSIEICLTLGLPIAACFAALSTWNVDADIFLVL